MAWILMTVGKKPKQVKVGDKRKTGHRETVEVMALYPPHKPSSSGRVEVRFGNGWQQTYYPNVIDCEFKEVP